MVFFTIGICFDRDLKLRYLCQQCPAASSNVEKSWIGGCCALSV